MKNRILTAILSAAMLFGILNISVAAEDNGLSSAEKICIGLGCISENEYKGDETVTRGKFAKILSDMCMMDTDTRYAEWFSSAYGDGTASADFERTNIFDDVDKSYPYYNEIMAVYSAGYMKGTGQKRFAPEYDITVLEVVKVISDMAGYSKYAEIGGGYPIGYEKTASDIGLLSGISGNIRRTATQSTVLRIIYNALDINMMEFKGLSEDKEYLESDKTFMEGVLKTYRVKGALTDNGITAIGGLSAINKKEVKVANVTATLPEDMDSFRKYIGRSVEMYYTYDEDVGEYTARFLSILDKDNSVTFSADDFVSYKDGRITFEQGKKTVSKGVKKGANLIYNNKTKSYYTADIFDFESGDITLCSTTDSDYNLIIVNNYETAYASYVNANDKTVYNGYKSASGTSNIIELTDDVYPDFIHIYTSDGEKTDFDAISTGSVLRLLRCDGGIEIVVSKEPSVELTIKSIGENSYPSGDRTVISDGTNEYEVLSSYTALADAVDFKAGQTVKLYFDGAGKVGWAELASSDDAEHIGVLIKYYYNEDEEADPVRMLTIYTDGGERKKIFADEKIKVNGQRKKFSDAQSELEKQIGNPIIYKQSENGKIESITTPAEYNEQNVSNRGWYRINPQGIKYRYGANGNDFDRFFYYVSGKTKVFLTPETYSEESYSDESKFALSSAGFTDNQEYLAEGFSASADAIEADVIVYRKYKDDSAKKEGNPDKLSAFLIQSVNTGLTGEDEEVLKLKGYYMSYGVPTAEYRELTVDPEAIMITSGEAGTEIDKDADINVVGPRVPSELAPGDVIRFETNSNGYLSAIRIAYDCDTGKSFHAGRGEEYGEASSYAGYAIARAGNGVKIATGKLPENINYSDFDEVKKNVKAFRISNCAIMVVEKNNQKVKIRTGTLDDILSYSNSLKNEQCDKLAVFTYYTSLAYGMVIYK